MPPEIRLTRPRCASQPGQLISSRGGPDLGCVAGRDSAHLLRVQALWAGMQVGQLAEVADVAVGRDCARHHRGVLSGVGECVGCTRRCRDQRAWLSAYRLGAAGEGGGAGQIGYCSGQRNPWKRSSFDEKNLELAYRIRSAWAA
jgi:hypothetical protein